MIYLFVIIFAYLCHYRFDKKRLTTKTKKIFYYLEYIVLVLVVGLRYRVGGDSLSYEDDYIILNGFRELTTYRISTSEHGFLWYAFVSCSQFISNEWVILQILHAIIFNYAVFKFVRKYSNMPFLAIFFYVIFNYLYFNTEILRASLGVAVFLLWGYDALLKKQWIKYVLLTFIASQFHIECIGLLLFPLAYLIGRYHINVVKMLILGLISVLILDFIKIETFLYYFAQFSDALMYRAAIYGQAVDRNTSGIIIKLMSMIPVFICVWLCKYMKEDDEISKLTRGLLIMYFIMSILVIYFPVIFSRIIDPIRICYVVTFANLFGKIRHNHSLYIFLFSLTLLGSYLPYIDKDILMKYHPYHSIFNPIKEARREFLYAI